jgi:hypothetical protein
LQAADRTIKKKRRCTYTVLRKRGIESWIFGLFESPSVDESILSVEKVLESIISVEKVYSHS